MKEQPVPRHLSRDDNAEVRLRISFCGCASVRVSAPHVMMDLRCCSSIGKASQVH